MKKILFVTTISGFLPQFEMNDVHILQKMGYEVHYASNFNNPVYSFEPAMLKREGIKLHHIEIAKSPLRIISNIKAVRQIKKIINEEQIDLVHCHNPMGAVAGRFASRLSKAKPYVIYTAHGFHFYGGAPVKNWLLYYPVERIAARWTDAIITINNEDYTRAATTFHLKKDGFVRQIHSVGIDMNRFKPDPKMRIKKREEIDIPGDAFHIVTAAELNKNKNQQVVIKAIARCDRKNIYYSICGKGKKEKYLKKLIDKLGLSERVRLLGYRTDMEEILQTADAFAFPSIREGLGVAAVEALSCGVPLIAGDNRGTREYAFGGRNAMICVSTSVDDFVQAISKLSTDSDYLSKLAAECRKSAELFDKNETIRVMTEVYSIFDEKINNRNRH